MGLRSGIKRWGCRLGLIRIVGTGPETPAKITPQVKSIKDLMTEGRRQADRATADLPGELSLPFEEVFKGAGVASAGKAWSIERLSDLLRGDGAPGQDRSKVREAVLRELAAEDVTVRDLVEDCRSRDRVLEDWEKRLRAVMEQRSQARLQRRAEIERQVADLQEAHTRLQSEDEQDQQQMRTWRQRKSACQDNMRGVIQALSDSSGAKQPADRSCP